MFSKIYLEITNACNLNCSFCPKTSRRKHFLTKEQFCFLADRLVGHTQFLYFHLMGEPLLHPLLGEFLHQAQKHGFKVIITTNGTLIGDKENVLLDSDALFKVSISLHSYEANSAGIEFEKYLSDCCRFADKASQKGIISVFRLCNDGGKNTLNPEIMDYLRKTFDGEWVQNTKGIRIRKKLFVEYGEKFDWPENNDMVSKEIRCYGMKDHVGVLCDGTVVPCCIDGQGSMPLGNLFDMTLDEILDSEKSRRISGMLRCGIAPEKTCESCGFAQNKFLHLQNN